MIIQTNTMFLSTEAMIISLPAPEEPPIIEATKLGIMAIHRVSRFLIQGCIFISRKPCKTQATSSHWCSTLVLAYGMYAMSLNIHTCMMYWPA